MDMSGLATKKEKNKTNIKQKQNNMKQNVETIKKESWQTLQLLKRYL